jgi:hypothetical protein
MIMFADTTEEESSSINSIHQTKLNDGQASLAEGCGFNSMHHPHPSFDPKPASDDRYLLI